MVKSGLAKFREIESVRWFRGLSKGQIKACNELLNALRDDTEQGTTYRVRRCFNLLGINPPIPSKRIAAIMKISNRNDLAFLWFIWESEYKRPRDSSSSIDIDNECFTVNEQLLYSAMAHLDMASTMRALDQILPPPSHSIKFINKKNYNVLKEKNPCPKVKQKLNQYVSPYFAPLVRPKQFVPKKIVKSGVQKLDFPEYSQYKNPMYKIPNEKSRWYSEYKLSPAKRIIKKFLSEEIDRLLIDSSSLFSDPHVGDPALCCIHTLMKEELALKQKEVADEALEKCLAFIDIEGQEKEARQKRIKESLEREIQCAADKMNQFSRRQLTQLTLLRSDKIDADCRLCHYLASSPAVKKGHQADLSVLMNYDDERVCHPMPPDEENCQFLKVSQLKSEGQPKSCYKTDDCIMVDTETLKGDYVKSNQVKIKESGLIRRVLGGGCGGAKKKRSQRKRETLYVKNEDSIVFSEPTTDFMNLKDLIPVCGHWRRCGKKTAQSCRQECYTTKTGCGLQLDYFKVFDPPELPPLPGLEAGCEEGEFRMDIEDKQPLIERCCVDVLNKTLRDQDEIEKWDNIEIPKNAIPPQSIKNAIDKCAVNIFKVEMAIRDGMNLSDLQIASDSKKLLKITNIDPDNRKQMVELLKAGLKILKHNPRYVLATFCNAHKLPILVDWVADRYGKTYDRKEMDDIVNSSFYLYEQIDRRHNPFSKLFELNASSLISYAEHDKFIQDAQCKKMHYYRELNAKELQQSRLIWLALRGYSHLSGFIGDTFFAYMPAREMDIKRHNLWKSSDYRDMVITRIGLQNIQNQK